MKQEKEMDSQILKCTDTIIIYQYSSTIIIASMTKIEYVMM